MFFYPPTGKSAEINKIEWSRPVKIYETAEIFLNLPHHGDIKVTVNGQEKVIRVIIDNINYVSRGNVSYLRAASNTSNVCIFF